MYYKTRAGEPPSEKLAWFDPMVFDSVLTSILLLKTFSLQPLLRRPLAAYEWLESIVRTFLVLRNSVIHFFVLIPVLGCLGAGFSQSTSRGTVDRSHKDRIADTSLGPKIWLDMRKPVASSARTRLSQSSPPRETIGLLDLGIMLSARRQVRGDRRARVRPRRHAFMHCCPSGTLAESELHFGSGVF